MKDVENIFNANITSVRQIKGLIDCTLVSFGCRFPVLSTYDRQTHLTLLINVRVVDLGFKTDLGRFKGVFCRECDLNPERTFVVWRVVLKKKRGAQVKWLNREKMVIFLCMQLMQKNIHIQ